jgi:Uma2 family endonuclease
MASVIFEEQVEIPMDIASLDAFRDWSHSDAFPERGRIDYLDGTIEVDMSPEDLYCHGLVKSEIAITLGSRIRDQAMGQLYIDRARVVSPRAELSAEPDVMFISNESLASGRIRMVPKAGNLPDRYVELLGGPDLVVEILSDSSEEKDKRRLWGAYFLAGVSEYWMVDARDPDEVVFLVWERGDGEFQSVLPDEDGFIRSEVMNCSYRLKREREDSGAFRFTLEELE